MYNFVLTPNSYGKDCKIITIIIIIIFIIIIIIPVPYYVGNRQNPKGIEKKCLFPIMVHFGLFFCSKMCVLCMLHVDWEFEGQNKR